MLISYRSVSETENWTLLRTSRNLCVWISYRTFLRAQAHVAANRGLEKDLLTSPIFSHDKALGVITSSKVIKLDLWEAEL